MIKNMENIKNVTGDATRQLGHLTDVSKAITIATSALSLGTAIAAGNPVSIVAATEALAQALGA